MGCVAVVVFGLPMFEYKITLGEVIQITLTLLLAGVSAFLAFRRFSISKWPLWLRHRTVDGTDRRVMFLANGQNQVRLILGTRLARRCARFQLEFGERDWRTRLGEWQVPTIDNISMSNVRITVSNDATRVSNMAGRQIHALTPPIKCAQGPMAVIDVVITCDGPWRGHLLVETSAENEVTKIASIPIIVS
jgi:hypothetical protein